MSSLRSFASRTPSTPASEKSVYFDAPLMHIFSRKRSSASTRSSRFNKNKDDDSSDGMPASGTGADEPGQDATAIPTPDPTPNLTASNPSAVPDVSGDETDVSTQEHPTSTSEAAATATANARQRNSSASNGGTASDSGYGSGGSNPAHKRTKSISRVNPPSAIGENDNAVNTNTNANNMGDIKPIPVVWSGDEDDEGGQETRPQTSATVGRSQSRMRAQSPWLGRPAGGADFGGRRANSVRSFRAGERGLDQDSVYTTGGGRRTPHRKMSLSGGTFAVGAGTIGPNSVAEVDESFEERSAAAERTLGKKSRNKLSRAELKEGKRLAAVIKAESKSEQKVLDIAIGELAEVQRMQKQAINEEARTATAHAKALRVFRREELEYFAARAKYERAQADLQTQEDIREASRDHAQEATELLQDKNREVEWLRAQKAADDIPNRFHFFQREREVKLMKLSGKA
ncbi:hypothetical protein EIP91_003449 [Steccherinum ochraceum]|uniref:Uncharacterized protein n=1 Tax=Steccherinum ochraceum TaxID=92696 RepID=A0A4R0RDX7_9APHY|nr:hypothetical protein EIP91_003449 [Steccherinum ochraceum]